jgi:hypothetical protein
MVLGHRYKARHVSISPDTVPFKDATPEALQWLYNEGSRVSAVLGVSGCVVVAHPYRIQQKFARLVNDSATKEGVNRYVWALRQENWKDFVAFSPHLHLHAFGRFMDADDFHGLTGWVYRNHDDNDKSGREGPELTKSIYYLLTHAWVRDNNRAVRYWGDLSNKRLEMRQIDTIREPLLCPDCGVHLVKVPVDAPQFDGTRVPFLQDIHNADHAYRKIPVYIYVVKLRKIRMSL